MLRLTLTLTLTLVLIPPVPASSESTAPRVYQDGQIAVIEDDGSLIQPPRTFDFSGRSIQFLRRPKGTSAVRSKLGFKQLIGERVEPVGGSVEIPFPESFRFPFFDGVYESVWVNANGTVTFGEPGATPPGLDDLVVGPPRIAALWTNADPSPVDGGVYVSLPPGRVRITWLRLTEAGTGAQSTVQLTLFTTGRAVVAYGDVNVAVAIVGVTPGVSSPLRLVDYDRELPLRPEPGILAEIFNPLTSVDIVEAAKAFFQQFEDRYSHLFLWTDFPIDLGPGRNAQNRTVKNDVRGIGAPVYDLGPSVGTENLYTFLQMRDIALYPNDPDKVAFGTYSTMNLLGHEFGHRWLAEPRFIDSEGSRSDGLLGRDLAHWSFYLDSDGSLMEGNALTDNGDGTFTTVDAPLRFSLLDQYLMGLIPAGEVPPFYYVRSQDGPDPGANPQTGVTFRGERVDLSIQDVIDAEGPRVPSAEQSPKTFRTAFVILGRQGVPISPASIEKLDRIRVRWHSYIQEVTDGRARVGTRLEPR